MTGVNTEFNEFQSHAGGVCCSPPQCSKSCSNTRCMGQEQRGVPSPLAMQMWEQPPLSREHGWDAEEETELLLQRHSLTKNIMSCCRELLSIWKWEVILKSCGSISSTAWMEVRYDIRPCMRVRPSPVSLSTLSIICCWRSIQYRWSPKTVRPIGWRMLESWRTMRLAPGGDGMML